MDLSQLLPLLQENKTLLAFVVAAMLAHKYVVGPTLAHVRAIATSIESISKNLVTATVSLDRAVKRLTPAAGEPALKIAQAESEVPHGA